MTPPKKRDVEQSGQSSRARVREGRPESTAPELAEFGRLEGDEALLAALLRGATLKDAGAEAGVPERTARRRVTAPLFRQRLDEGRAQVTTMIAAQLAGAAELGYGVLLDLAKDTATPAAVRRNAARDLLAMAGQLGAVRDMEARVEALEAALEKAGIEA